MLFYILMSSISFCFRFPCGQNDKSQVIFLSLREIIQAGPRGGGALKAEGLKRAAPAASRGRVCMRRGLHPLLIGGGSREPPPEFILKSMPF